MVFQTNAANENGTRRLSLGASPSQIRVGIVGAGKMAANHARAIAACSARARLVAIADPSDTALASLALVAPDAKKFGSLSQLLKDERVDVIHVCTPPSLHTGLAIEALESGSHVYVEKPFANSVEDAERVLETARFRGLKVAAGHQLLHEKPTRIAADLFPSLGRIAHLESYFSFRPVRRAPGGRVPLASDLQLLDILPHPVYLLLNFLKLSDSGQPELLALNVGEGGTVHALIRQGSVTGSLIVTLQGRPVESYLRVVGTNGALHADYVRGTVQRHIGPGTSGIDKVLAPFRTAGQLIIGTTSALGARVLNRQRSYPGLAELFDAFYRAIQTGSPSPVSEENILETTRICEQVAARLRSSKREASTITAAREIKAGVLLTGGTGSLGTAVAKELVAAGRAVRAVSRRLPAAWERVDGVEYAVADLSQPLREELFHGITAVIHTAAETAGGWEEHQRNSIDATSNILRAAAAAGVSQVVHVSSLAVLQKPRRRRPVTDETPLASPSRSFGPYVWGKLESERLAVELARTLDIQVKIVRPGPLVDFENFEPPGRLGRRIGNFFVAVGTPRHRLAITNIAFAARVLTWMLDSFDSAPETLNLLDPVLPTKRDVLDRLRTRNPDLTVIWLPMPLLSLLSSFASVAQKVVRPRKPVMNVARAFESPAYDTSRIASVASLMNSPRAESAPPPRVERQVLSA
ncbi:MAG TPA: Gfo/Idh/MocA family oxidoreductase [Gemmatimonadaceae bacterium]|nr:Gfo/Idh/MocA family oxidoreductase [Gemmatimonadaceae bacterium]